MYNPAKKPGLCHKFHKPWTGPFKVTAKLSDLNYEIISLRGKRFVVHINRLNRAYSEDMWEPKTNQKTLNKEKFGAKKRVEEEEVTIGSAPILLSQPPEPGTEQRTAPDPVLDTAEVGHESLDTPSSEARDPTYVPPNTPLSSRELRTIRPEPPITRSRTRIQMQDGQT